MMFRRVCLVFDIGKEMDRQHRHLICAIAPHASGLLTKAAADYGSHRGHVNVMKDGEW